MLPGWRREIPPMAGSLPPPTAMKRPNSVWDHTHGSRDSLDGRIYVDEWSASVTFSGRIGGFFIVGMPFRSPSWTMTRTVTQKPPAGGLHRSRRLTFGIMFVLARIGGHILQDFRIKIWRRMQFIQLWVKTHLSAVERFLFLMSNCFS